jgi:hypothetical protein
MINTEGEDVCTDVLNVDWDPDEEDADNQYIKEMLLDD